MNYTKKSLKHTLILVATALLLHSCGAKDSYETVTVENKFELTLPSFLSKTRDLNDDASLQYQNALREFYVIAIHEPIIEVQPVIDEDETGEYKNDINGYYKLILDNFKGAIANPEISKVTDTIVNNMPAKTAFINGQIDGLDIVYAIGLYQGKEDYYQLFSWTLADRKDRHKDNMSKIIYSLKEVEETE